MPLPNIKETYEKAWRAIIMPHKLEYSLNDMGPTEFKIQHNTIKRTDFRITNKRGVELACSLFENISVTGPIPCVVYLHANGSCRLEALQYKQVVLAQNVHYCCFDFTGCGQSGGAYTSVGYFEQCDVERVLEFLLKETNKVTKIALWGRSMGAVTAIMYSTINPAISCIILDSPFASFQRLVHELVKSRSKVPKFLASIALKIIRRTVKNKAKFDVCSIKPIEYVNKLKIPALFGAPKDDTFVSAQHTKDLYLAYKGQKRLTIFEGDHNSRRPIEWVVCIVDFLQVHLLEKKNTPYEYFSEQPMKQPQPPFGPTMMGMMGGKGISTVKPMPKEAHE